MCPVLSGAQGLALRVFFSPPVCLPGHSRRISSGPYPMLLLSSSFLKVFRDTASALLLLRADTRLRAIGAHPPGTAQTACAVVGC